MRSFFQSVVKNISGNAASQEGDRRNINTGSSVGNSSIVSTFKREDPIVSDYNCQLCAAAGQALNDAILHLLSKKEDLTADNMTGFENLVQILESTEYHPDVTAILDTRGYGALQLLHEHMNKPYFIDICSEAGLPLAILQALRLLKIYEIHLSKVIPTDNFEASTTSKGKTYLASSRICKIFTKVAKDAQAIEKLKLRNEFLKLLLFPLVPMPPSALHLQVDSAEVIRIICMSNLPAKQVWYLHDENAVQLMTKSIQELFTEPGSETPKKDKLLRGGRAELVGMWSTAVSCLVDIITASVSISPCLMSDFENADGYKLLQHFLYYSSPQNFMLSVSIYTRLLFDPSKSIDEAIAFPNIGIVLANLLATILGIDRCVDVSDSFDVLIATSQTILDGNRNQEFQYEYIVQSIAYTILTIYSNAQKTCSVLENMYNFLPTLILSIPVLKNGDSSSAIFTTLNYVCQCIETVASQSLIALCATSTVIANRTLSSAEEGSGRSLSSQQLDVCYKAFDAIVRSHSKFAEKALQCGMLQHLVCVPLESIRVMVSQGHSIDEFNQRVYIKLADFLISIHKRNIYVADAIRNSGIYDCAQDLIISSSVSVEFSEHLLMIYEELSRAGTQQLIEALSKLLTIIRHILSAGITNNLLSITKLLKIIVSLATIFKTVLDAPSTWNIISGDEIVLSIIGCMSNIFSSTEELSDRSNHLECLMQISRFFSVVIYTTSFSHSDEQYYHLYHKNRLFNQEFIRLVKDTRIFDSPHAEEYTLNGLFAMVSGSANTDTIVNPYTVEVLLDALECVNTGLGLKVLDKLIECADCTHYGYACLSESKVIALIIVKFHRKILDKSSKLGQKLLYIVKKTMRLHLSVDDFSCYINYFIRNDVIVDEKRAFLLPPSCVYSTLHASRAFDYIDFLVDLGYQPPVSPASGNNKYGLLRLLSDDIPHIILGSGASKTKRETSFINILIHGNDLSFYSSGFITFSIWLRLSHATISGSYIPLLALCTNSAGGCFVEAYYDIKENSICVIWKKGSVLTTILYKKFAPFAPQEWTLFTLQFRKARTISPSFKVFSFINGLSGEPLNSNSMDTDIPLASDQIVEFVVGKLFLCQLVPQRNSSSDGSTSSMDPDNIPEWHLGSLGVYDEFINSNQVGILYMMGPKGWNLSFSPLINKSKNFATIACNLLYKVDQHRSTMAVRDYLANIGLSGIEEVVDPPERSTNPPKVDLYRINHPKLLFVSHNSTGIMLNLQGTDNSNISRSLHIELPNSSSFDALEKHPMASVINGGVVSSSCSIAECVFALGGPSIFFPIIQAASSEQMICKALNVLDISTKMNLANMEYMRVIGYKICAFLLSIKPKAILTSNVVNSLFQCCVSETSYGVTLAPSFLLCDTSAFSYFVLNHQVWGDGKFNITDSVIQKLSLLCNDVRHGAINCHRLASLGAVRWLLSLLLHGIAVSKSHSSSCENDWSFNKCTVKEIASSNHQIDPFIGAVVAIIRQLMRVGIKQADLNFIAIIISFTFCHASIIQTLSTSNYAAGDDKESDTLEGRFSVAVSESSEMEILPLGMLRIYLLETLFILLEESSDIAKFASSFSIDWFLGTLEKVNDDATMSNLLRFLGLMIQKDAGFQKQFCAKNGLKDLELQLNLRDQYLSVILPLLCLLFRIPIHLMPQPYEIRSADRVIQLLETVECLGPDITEQSFVDFTLPVLRIILNWVSYHCHQNSVAGRDGGIQNEITLGLFELAISKQVSFNQMLQHRFATEMIANAVLLSTHALDKFEAHIYSVYADKDPDLSAALLDNYIPASSVTSESSSYGAFSAFKTIDDEYFDPLCHKDIVFTTADSVRLSSLIASTMTYGLKEFQNSQIILNYILYFPRNLSLPYVYSYQKIILDTFREVISKVLESANDIILKTVINNFTSLIPLIKSSVLDDGITTELIVLLVDVLNVEISRYNKKSNDPIVKETVLTIRYYYVMSIEFLGNSISGHAIKDIIKTVFRTMRENVDKLIPSYLEDATELSIAKSGKKADNFHGISVLDYFQVSWDMNANGAHSRRIGDTYYSLSSANINAERLKLGPSFCLSMLFTCLKVMKNATDSELLFYSVHIFRSLILQKQRYIEFIFGSSNEYSKKQSDRKNTMSQLLLTTGKGLFGGAEEKQIEASIPDAVKCIREGITLLSVSPNKTVSNQGECKAYVNVDIEDETIKINSFIQWFQANSETFTNGLVCVESYFHSTCLTANSFDTIRQLISVRSKELQEFTTYSRALASMERAEERYRLHDKATMYMNRWKFHGLLSIAFGTKEWKKCWECLQSSSLWCAPASDTTVMRRHWKLDPTEGTERTRRRLQEDYYLLRKDLDTGVKKPVKTISSNLRDLSIIEAGGMEHLLKEIARKGIKRLNISDSDRMSVVDTDLDIDGDIIYIDNTAVPTIPAQAADSNKIEIAHDSCETSFTADLSGKDVSHKSILESDVNSRSQLIVEVVRGIVGVDEYNNGKMYNIHRIHGLETVAGTCILTKKNLHFIIGITAVASTGAKSEISFDFTGDTLENSILSDKDAIIKSWEIILAPDQPYHVVPFDEVYSIFRRRHQLKYQAIEITDTTGYSILFSLESTGDANEILLKLLQAELPSSIFFKVIGIKNLELLRGLSNVYNRLLSLFVSRITRMWQTGELSNFEYLMHLNSASGRSFQDLTQYPVFPWILADYTSETVDLNEPSSFRDLSRPMGALGSKRAAQYVERYETMVEFVNGGVEGSAPPFFYGTHYSCAGYVLNYLLRLQPYSDYARSLQGGHFDKPDRLFKSIDSSWRSASHDNIQDVRELIPEFFYLPEFLVNSNKFDFGVTQKDEVVDGVLLPMWAHGDPKEFIRIHRLALESKYVSEHLHEWIDLIFGYKQRGVVAEESMNLYIHLTYDNEVDIDAITDPVLKESIIAQINNFGLCPSQLFKKPHPKRNVPDVIKRLNDTIIIETASLQWHSKTSPPLCVVGAPGLISLAPVVHTKNTVFRCAPESLAVGDVRLLSRERILIVPKGSVLVGPKYKRIAKFGGVNCGISIHSRGALTGKGHFELDKDAVLCTTIHQKKILSVAVSRNGKYLATGSEDLTVKLWKLTDNTIVHVGTLLGHVGAVLALDLNLSFEMLVSGSVDKNVCVWDTRLVKLIRTLGDHKGEVVSVSCNSINGDIVSLTSSEMRIYSINGEMLSAVDLNVPCEMYSPVSAATKVLAVPTAEWQAGIVGVTGHENGCIYFWKFLSASRSLVPSYRLKFHNRSITCLRLCETEISQENEIVERSYFAQMNLCVGDSEGNVGRYKSVDLDKVPSEDVLHYFNNI